MRTNARSSRSCADATSAWCAWPGTCGSSGPCCSRRIPNRIVNIHPSLLPSFPGFARAATGARARRHACPAPRCIWSTRALDAGPIVLQAAVPVLDDDTVDTLSERILVEEHRIYPEALRILLDGRWNVSGRRVTQAAAGRRLSTATSGGQLIRTGTYTVPRPRLTNIVVWSRRPIPATTGNFCAAIAPDERQHHLSAVRVAREDERYLQGGRFGEPSRIVRQQDDEACRAARDGGDVAAALRPEADSDQIDGFALDRDARSGVLQHLDAAARSAPPACRGRRRGCRGCRTRRAAPRASRAPRLTAGRTRDLPR